MANITRTMADAAGFIPQMWAKRALSILRSQMVLAQFVRRDFDFEPGWVGNVRSVISRQTCNGPCESDLHPVTGENICKPLHSLRLVLPIIRHHHEHSDGSGYPDGLTGSEIPVLPRVLQVVDVYDALGFGLK